MIHYIISLLISSFLTGNCHEVYPTANHSRFEHCIGVMHLGKYKQIPRIRCQTLIILATVAIEKLRASGARITEAEQLCVEIGGLCHDLGKTTRCIVVLQ